MVRKAGREKVGTQSITEMCVEGEKALAKAKVVSLLLMRWNLLNRILFGKFPNLLFKMHTDTTIPSYMLTITT